MVYAIEAVLRNFIVHHIGNKTQDERYVLANTEILPEDETLISLLKHYFMHPFQKTIEIYRFYHPNEDLKLNEVYSFINDFFNHKVDFVAISQQIAKYLYEVSAHPKIKSGELYIVHFENLQIEGELHQAIGIFKSENKESYLKVQAKNEGFEIAYEQNAININKLDKGCVVFNTEATEGFKVAILDATNRSQEAVYWKDEFLGLKVRNDNFQKTSQIMGVYKDFVTQKMDDDFDISKADKIDLLNKSMHYFKNNETFDMEDFSQNVIGNPQGIDLFKQYKSSVSAEFDLSIDDQFEIANAAVKKQSKIYKSVLKLDKNFHIYIHGGENKIEKGFDDERKMNYYKVYFEQEC